MKKTLQESTVIRFYMLLWGFFIVGVLIALPFSQTTSEWRWVAFGGFLLSAGSFIATLTMLSSVQAEIRERYADATNEEKKFFTGLFYFARGVFLLLGLFILMQSFGREDVLEQDLVEISGKILSVEVVGQDDSSLKIVFENSSNQYGIRTFKVSDENLQRIENELQSGDTVFVLIENDDVRAVNDQFVQIYGIRTTTNQYFTLDEYNRLDSMNNFYGYFLGMFFTGSGIIYLVTGRIQTRKIGLRNRLKS
ncbi:MAG: hypothetical protein AB1607_02975 [Chloroflexota bacterium]